ncbi:MAG: hypothetical protein JW705_00205 [Methanosarcinaceae archaeon]|nr:hypothetical protein [Methanosarcinaceae archaeon]
MKIKKYTIGMNLLMIVCLLFSPAGLAAGAEITDVERHVPSGITVGKMAEITLEITGEGPFMAGIVETIPQGFTFPENDADVSDARHFKVDRDAGKISFSVSDETEVTYNVIPSGSDGSGFEGYWVDLLYQTQALNEGKERWIAVTDPNSVFSTNFAGGATSSSDRTSPSKAPGFGLFLSSMSLVASLCFIRKYNSGGDKE